MEARHIPRCPSAVVFDSITVKHAAAPLVYGLRRLRRRLGGSVTCCGS